MSSCPKALKGVVTLPTCEADHPVNSITAKQTQDTVVEDCGEEAGGRHLGGHLALLAVNVHSTPQQGFTSAFQRSSGC